MSKSKVYFSREISPEALIRVYEALGVELTGRVAVKVSSGERVPRATSSAVSSSHS